jgi:hypothetical protein
MCRNPVQCQVTYCHSLKETAMIVLGIVLLILGYVFAIPLLWTIGIILIVIGAVMWILGSVGRPVAGRRYWY